MAMTEERRRQISREIDEETDRRIAARTHRVEPEPRDTRTAAERKALHDSAWNNWVDAKLRYFVHWDNMQEFAQGVGLRLATLRTDTLDEMAEAVGKVVAQVRDEAADAIA